VAEARLVRRVSLTYKTSILVFCRSSRSLSFEDDLPWSDDAPVGKAPALALSSQAPSRSEKSAGSASDSSPITPQALSPSTEFPSKLEVGGSKPNNTASVSPPSSAMGDKPVQRSLIPVPTKTPSQSRKDDFREVTAADVTATDVKRDVGIFESKQVSFTSEVGFPLKAGAWKMFMGALSFCICKGTLDLGKHSPAIVEPTDFNIEEKLRSSTFCCVPHSEPQLQQELT